MFKKGKLKKFWVKKSKNVFPCAGLKLLCCVPGITCDNTETSLLACPHLGWNGVHFKCEGHDTDAGVLCKRNGIAFCLLTYSTR